MRKRFILHIGFLALLLPLRAFASETVTGTLNTDVWYLETEVMINGTHLQGPMPSRSKLCFAPAVEKGSLLCFKAGHGNINKWTASHITFIPPKNAPPVGVVILVHPYEESECTKLYRKLRCRKVGKRRDIEIASYQAHPHIAGLTDYETGEAAEFLEAGRTYELTGYRFGETGAGIYVNRKMLDRPDVSRWTYDSILFTPSQSFLDPAEIEVHNGGGRGNAWQIAGAPKGEVVQTKTRGLVALQTPRDAVPREQTESLEARTALFRDVTVHHTHYDAIAWAVGYGVVHGYEEPSGARFRGYLPVSRAEFLKILMEAEGRGVLPVEETASFVDVPPDAWYAPYVEFAKREKIVEGYEGGVFLPGRDVTLAEGLKMAYRLLKIPTLDPQGDAWYARYHEHAQTHGILFDTRTDPALPLSREDAVWMVWKLTGLRGDDNSKLQAKLE